MTDELRPTVFNHDEWVDYSDRRTNAIVLCGLGVTLFVAGFASGVAAMTMQGSDLATLEIASGQFWGGQALAVLGVLLGSFGWDQWTAAGRIRDMAERENLISMVPVVTVAAVALKALKMAADSQNGEIEEGEP